MDSKGVQEVNTQQTSSSNPESNSNSSSSRKELFPPLFSASSTSAKTDICQFFQMDELFTPADIEVLQKSRHRWSSTKFFRRKQKRIPCTYEFPKCINCKRDNAECHVWVRGLRKPSPRSVAELEIELKKLKQQHVIDDLEECSYSITKSATTPLLESFDIGEDVSTLFSGNLVFFHR